MRVRVQASAAEGGVRSAQCVHRHGGGSCVQLVGRQRVAVIQCQPSGRLWQRRQSQVLPCQRQHLGCQRRCQRGSDGVVVACWRRGKQRTGWHGVALQHRQEGARKDRRQGMHLGIRAGGSAACRQLWRRAQLGTHYQHVSRHRSAPRIAAAALQCGGQATHVRYAASVRRRQVRDKCTEARQCYCHWRAGVCGRGGEQCGGGRDSARPQGLRLCVSQHGRHGGRWWRRVCRRHRWRCAQRQVLQQTRCGCWVAVGHARRRCHHHAYRCGTWGRRERQQRQRVMCWRV